MNPFDEPSDPLFDGAPPVRLVAAKQRSASADAAFSAGLDLGLTAAPICALKAPAPSASGALSAPPAMPTVPSPEQLVTTERELLYALGDWLKCQKRLAELVAATDENARLLASITSYLRGQPAADQTRIQVLVEADGRAAVIELSPAGVRLIHGQVLSMEFLK